MIGENRVLARSAFRALALAAVICQLQLPAHAQQPIQATGSNTIEEVLVLARKREESQQTVPVAISAITGDDLTRQFAIDISDISGNVPNATLETEPISPLASSFYIRGLGSQDREYYADPPVLVSVNGIPQGTGSIAMTDLLDVQAIEVLRGPQGTLQGRNTIGGAILLRQNAPVLDETNGSLTLLAGSRGRQNVSAVVNLPIVEGRAAFRVAAKSTNFDGFYNNAFNNTRTGGQDRRTILPSFFYEGDNWDATLRGEWVKIRDDSASLVPYNLCGADPRDPANVGIGANDLFVDIVAGQLGGDAAFATCARELDEDLFDINMDRAQGEFLEIDIEGITAEVNYEVDGAGTITYVGSYRETEEFSVLDADGTPLDLISGPRFVEHRQVTHELRFASNFSDFVEFIAGVHFMEQSYNRTQQQGLGFIAPGLIFPFRETLDHSHWAIFGQADWNLTERLTLVTGVRYTEEEKDGLLCPQAPIACEQRTLGTPGLLETVGSDWDNISPRVGLDFQLADNLFLYGYWARGFRSGGFNMNAANAAQAGPFDEEILDTYEVGFKLDLFGQRARLNGAVFHMKADDLQRIVIRETTTGSPGSFTQNAASATIQGVELELSALLTNDLTLNFSVGYLDSEYDEFCEDLNGAAPNDPSLVPCAPATALGQPVDLSDLPLARNPEWNIRTNAIYDVDLGSYGVASLSAEWIHTDELATLTAGFPTGTSLGVTQFNGFDVSPIRDSTDIVNASITWRDQSERVRIALFGKNLTNEIYLTRLTAAGIFGFIAPNNPRHYGIELSVDF